MIQLTLRGKEVIMSFDLQNTDVNNLGMGGLSQFLSQAQSAEMETARQVNAGKVPSLGGGGTDISPVEVPSQVNAGGGNSGGFPQSGYHQVQSMNHHVGGRETDKVLGQEKSISEITREQKHKGKHVYASIAKGYEVNDKKELTSFMRPPYGVWNENDRLFGKINTMEQKVAFIKKTGYIVKPQDVFALGLMPASVKTNIDMAIVNLRAPKAQQIVSGASAGDVQNSQQVFDNSSGDTQRQVAAALDTNKDDGQKAFKPAAKLAAPKPPTSTDGRSSEWLH